MLDRWPPDAALLGILARLQQTPHPAQRAREDLLHVGERETGELGDLGTGQVATEAQGDQLTFAVTEGPQGLLEVGVEPEVGVGRSAAAKPDVARFVLRERLLAAPLVAPVLLSINNLFYTDQILISFI